MEAADYYSLFVYLLSLLPLIEGRYAVLYGLGVGLDVPRALASASLGVVTLGAFLPRILALVENKINWRIYRDYVAKVRRRGEPYVRKWGFFGLVLFVAIPFPTTGVYTGALVGHLLGIRRLNAALITGGLISVFLTAAPYLELRAILG